MPSQKDWPVWPAEDWSATYATLHMMTQVVGKIRLACAPPVNHWWHVTLYLTSRGLATSAMTHGARSFDLTFDFVDHALVISESDGGRRTLPLRAGPISVFYHDVMAALDDLGTPVRIMTRPVEVVQPIPFEADFEHTAYVPQHAHVIWQAMRRAEHALAQFRSAFIGKCSPVHFFWGAFDLAVTRFSGRPAPLHPGGVPNLADWVVREAYSHECSSAGFWPGGGAVPAPAFYCYAYPEPAGFAQWPVSAPGAYYDATLREFILPYETVRQAEDPDGLLHDFLQSTYEAGAELGAWDRAALERA